MDYKKEETKLEGEKISHPAYGTMLFSRCTHGGGTPLFGSSIQHKDTIRMRLYHADITRELSSDHIFGGNLIAEAEMSYSQFAEAITSMNMGTGVPVTIRYTEKNGETPSCDFVNKREQFTNEFKGKLQKAMQDSQDLINEVREMFEQKTPLKKAEKDAVLRKLLQLNYNIGCNAEFVANQFNEQMDKTIMEAKGEIEAFCQNKINSIASDALVEKRDELKKLSNPVEL